jgi:hypothetical protein
VIFATEPVFRDVSPNPTEGIVKRTSSHLAIKKKTGGAKVRRAKQAGRRQLNDDLPEMNPTSLFSEESCLTQDQLALDQPDLKRLKELPREVGVMLIAAGVVGLVLPGPGTPALVAGGLALWPGAFSKLELWLERRHPEVHQKSMKQIGRFLDDLEKRYPYSKRK